MKCNTCGYTLDSSREDWDGDCLGLPGVIVRDVSIRRCANCGTHDVIVKELGKLYDLYRTTSRSDVTKRWRAVYDHQWTFEHF